ncbi:restriction endonuclease subunit S [Flavobacterium sp.]|uniref:restriction endonuclease subunit S n=1 Tax=Flavobacterium sp. TaxID=239 RepID=UPI0022C5A644|nr:restriction endonuclease subunit S [Flavobacterium sp.]MCZ8229442.1 restriction endonuclease subunit S [Flavobacterium sp.]
MEFLTPKLRFPEFDENWKLKQLGDIGNFIGGGTPSTSNEDFWKGDIPWISSSDIFDNEIQDIRMSRFLTKEAIKESATKIIPKNSILLVSRVGVGKLAINKVEVCTSQDFTNIIVYDDNSYFIGYNLISKKNILSNFSQGTSIKGFTSNDIKTLGIKVPSLEEQTKIANFLSAVDNKLNLLKEKKALLEEYKKGIMQKIFNQEIRFKDDNGEDFGEWEEKKFSNYIKLYRGSSPRPIVRYITNSKNGVNWIKIGDTKGIENYIIDNVSEKITSEGAKHSRKVDVGEIILANSMSFGKSYILNISGCIYDGWFVLREYEKVFDKMFLIQLLNSDYLQKQYNTLSTGGVVQNISSEIVYSTFLLKPSIDEQTKIANFLSAIDEKIALVSNQIQDTQEYKKGLLQQMFV